MSLPAKKRERSTGSGKHRIVPLFVAILLITCLVDEVSRSDTLPPDEKQSATAEKRDSGDEFVRTPVPHLDVPLRSRRDQFSIMTSRGRFRERLIPLRVVSDDWSLQPATLIASPDSAHVAYRMVSTEQSNKARAVAMDHQLFGPQRDIFGPVFNPDSSGVAFLGLSNGWKLQVNDQSIPGFVPVAKPKWSPDGSRLAYIARRGSLRFCVIDHMALPDFDEILDNDVRFSANGQRFAFVGRRARRWFVNIDGQEFGPFDRVPFIPHSSANASITIFAGVQDGMSRMYHVMDLKTHDVKISGRFLDVSKPVFSDDSNRFAYWSKQGDGTWAVRVNRTRDLRATADVPGDIIFSPDSKTVAAAMKHDGSWVVHRNKEVYAGYDAVGRGTLKFSPDSQSLVFAAMEAGRWFIIRDGNAIGNHDAILGGLVFSDDGEHFAYAARDKGRWQVYLDGLPVSKQTYDAVRGKTLKFSADGARLAFLATVGDGPAVVVLDKQGEDEMNNSWIARIATGPQQMSPPMFSQDGVVGWMQFEDGELRAVIEGIPCPHAFDSIVPGARLISSQPGRFHTLVYRNHGSQVYRLEIQRAADPTKEPALVDVPMKNGNDLPDE